jgi:two-component system NarL family sensor kinase
MSMKGHLIITPESHLAFERSIAMLDMSLRDMRQVAQQMIPEVLVSQGLDAALKELCQHVARPDGPEIVYESFGLQSTALQQEVAVAVYGIVQELLKNTIQHAGAGKVSILVTNQDGKFSIAVEDNGKGFDTTLLPGGRGEGWTNILHKMETLHGSINTRSAPGTGTTVRLELAI